MPTLPSTPKLEALLTRLSRQLSTQVWLHGLGTLLAVTATWLLFVFLADVGLHVPKAVRWLHFGLLLAIPGFFLRRDLLQPLGRRPDRSGLAVLVERTHPESHELVVSAIQLGAGDPDAPNAELVQRVLRDAEQYSAEIDTSKVIDSTAPRRRFGLGVCASVVATAIFLSSPAHSSIFFKRLIGMNVPWPQRTHLTIKIPVIGENQRVEASEDEIRLRVARGSDVPILVEARGVVPNEVTLHFDSGHSAVLAASGGRVFRTLLRSCQEDLVFYATGGDDEDGRPVVRLTVMQPPDVAGIAIESQPPAYSDLLPRLEFDTDVEVLAGTRVRVFMLPEPLDALGNARILPEDRVIELSPAPYPVDPRTAEAEGEERQGLSFELTAEETLRFLFELQDSSGLPNPDPGLFAIHVVEDRAPEIEILAPGRGDVDTVLGGAISLRARAQDDYGLTSMRWGSSPSNEEDVMLAEGALEWRSIEPAVVAEEGAAPRQGVFGLGSRLLEVSALSGEQPLLEGRQFTLRVTAEDNREPQAQLARSVAVRVRVVSTEEFLRRVQDRLARVRIQATQLGELQREKLNRTLELVSSLESDQLEDGTEAADLTASLSGQRRVQGDADALTRELSSIVETVLYARIDERASDLLEELDRSLAHTTDRGFQSAAWQSLLNGYKQGILKSSGLAGKLVEILGHGMEISETHSRTATQSLVRANQVSDLAAVHQALSEARESQAKTLASVESLLELLAEWDNFQSVLTLTRDILNRQKNLEERTRQFAKDN